MLQKFVYMCTKVQNYQGSCGYHFYLRKQYCDGRVVMLTQQIIFPKGLTLRCKDTGVQG